MRLGAEVLPAGLRRSGGSADSVRGCPCDGPPLCPRARTYNGQRRCRERGMAAIMQVSGYVVWIGAEHCKTVGSAYVGSNPTPATTCENAPLAAKTRARRAVSSLSRRVSPCRAVDRHIALSTDASRGRGSCYKDGRCAQLRRSGCTVVVVGVHRRRFHGRPRTGRASGVSSRESAPRAGRVEETRQVGDDQCRCTRGLRVRCCVLGFPAATCAFTSVPAKICP